MKALSASVVVLSAAILLTGGSWIPHNDTKLFVQLVGCFVGLLGLGAWLFILKEKEGPD